MTTDIQDAKAKLAELVSEAARGAEVIINVDGVPQARLIPVVAASTTPWDVRKYADLWKNSPMDSQTASSTDLIRRERDSRFQRESTRHVYLDSSVIAKVLLNEPDSPQWRARIMSATSHQSQTLSLVEVRSALRQKKLLGAISVPAAQQVWQQFQQDIRSGQLTLMPLTQPVMEEAVRILDSLPDSVPLRSLDALHLASARVFNLVPLATNDSRMIAAAQALGIPLV